MEANATATATSQSAKGGSKGHQYTSEQRSQNKEECNKFTDRIPESQEGQAPEGQGPEGQGPEGQLKMSQEQINWILFSFALHGRFTKNVIDLIKKVGLPIPAQGSLSSIEDLIVKMKTIFIRRIPKM